MAPQDWLGYKYNREKVKKYNLWNQNHAEEAHESDFLDILEKLVAGMSIDA